MTSDALQAIRARAEAATAPPWARRYRGPSFSGGPDWHYIWAPLAKPGEQAVGDGVGEANADFIVHAREDVPVLIRAIEERDAVIRELADSLEGVQIRTDANEGPFTIVSAAAWKEAKAKLAHHLVAAARAIT